MARKNVSYNRMPKYRVAHTALDPEKSRCVQNYIVELLRWMGMVIRMQ